MIDTPTRSDDPHDHEAAMEIPSRASLNLPIVTSLLAVGLAFPVAGFDAAIPPVGESVGVAVHGSK